MFFKLYLFIRLANHYYPFYRRRENIKKIVGKKIRFGWHFVMKKWFHNHPIVFSGVVVALTIFIFSYSIYVGEREKQPHTFGRYRDAIWNTCVTFTTTGYGDISARSNLGRTVAVFTMFVGLGVIAIVTAVVLRLLELNSLERKASDVYDLIVARESQRDFAARLLQLAFRRHILKKKHDNSKWKKDAIVFDRKKAHLIYNLYRLTRDIHLLQELIGDDSVNEKILKSERGEGGLETTTTPPVQKEKNTQGSPLLVGGLDTTNEDVLERRLRTVEENQTVLSEKLDSIVTILQQRIQQQQDQQ